MAQFKNWWPRGWEEWPATAKKVFWSEEKVVLNPPEPTGPDATYDADFPI